MIRLLIIDRFEGEFAVCENEDGKVSNIHISKLEKSADVGSVLILIDEVYSPDEDETLKRKQQNISLTEKLRKKLSEKQ